jgi:hypothetical protein
MFGTKKYRLLPAQIITLPSGKKVNLHKIVALIDIPRHGVKKNDLGGYVSSKRILSHKGDAWVGGSAIVHDIVDFELIRDDALVTDHAVVTNEVSGTSKVHGHAYSSLKILGSCDVSGKAILEDTTGLGIGRLSGDIVIKDNVRINGVSIESKKLSTITIAGDVKIDTGNARSRYRSSSIRAEYGQHISLGGSVLINNVTIRGNCTMFGDFRIEECDVDGDTMIIDSPTILPGAIFTGTNVISGNAHIPPGSRVHNITMDTGDFKFGVPHIGQTALDSTTTPVIEEPKVSNETQECIDIINDTEKEYESYTTDIVKLIKFPAMADTSIPEIKDFLYNLRSAKRAIKGGNVERIAEHAEKVEKSFLDAENTARTMATSHLDNNKKEALKKAGQMFALAADEASPEPEKRLSVKAGLRSLEGVLLVSDEAIEVLKNRLGLRELGI